MGPRASRILRAIARGDMDQARAKGDRRAVDALAPDLPGALRREELTLHFQPIVDLRSGRCARVEALLRWTHPAYGIVDPRDIVRLAEAAGLVREIGLWVVRAAARRRTAWSADGLELGVAMNLSRRDLEAGGSEALLDAIQAGGARPSVFTFELPATELVRIGELRAGLARLSAAGARIALDDASAADMPARSIASTFDELKISRSLVRRAAADPSAAVTLRSLLAVARDLGLASVAVGVEDRATLEVVASLQCDRAQGYWMSRPLATADVARWHGWAAGLALGGTAAVVAFAGTARVALAAQTDASTPSSARGPGATCCALWSDGGVHDVGVSLREFRSTGARVLAEESIAAAAVARVVDAVSRDLPATERALGAKFDAAPTVYVFATRGSFALALQRGFGQRSTEAAALAATNGGVAFARDGTIAINWENVRGETSLPIVRHELTHLLTHQLAGAETELPAWFDEGLATLAEREVVADEVRDARGASATLVLLRNSRASLQGLSSPQDWTMRNAELDGRGYTVAAEAVALLRTSIGPNGVALLLTQARAVGFARAFGEATGGSVADFAAAFPARFASANGAPRIAQIPSAEGVQWSVGGAAALSPLRVAIDGADYHVEFDARADRDGVYTAVFGSTVRRGQYTVTVSVRGVSTSATLRV
jgi:EAL domain-containing protein (putative c-di-GMP-specific phosphodiesterase class I)